MRHSKLEGNVEWKPHKLWKSHLFTNKHKRIQLAVDAYAEDNFCIVCQARDPRMN